MSGEDGVAPLLTGCPSQLDSRVAQEREPELLACPCGVFPRGKEERKRLEASVPLGQEGRADSLPLPFRLPELVGD